MSQYNRYSNKKDGIDVKDGNEVKYNSSVMGNVQRSMYFKNC